jgi:hypothetical protein
MKQAAVAIPLANRSDFTADEEISLRLLDRHLGGYDRYFILPEGLKVQHQNIGKLYFEPHYFGSVAAHKRLLFADEFYRRFENYEYVLIYHLDAAVFSDRLDSWCGRGYDYIAPPWIPHPDAPYAGDKNYEGKVGNGGFSLRRIEGFRKVIRSRRLWRSPEYLLRQAIRGKGLAERLSKIIGALKSIHWRFNGVRQEMAAYAQNEDHFWAARAQHYYPGFRIAPLDVALEFAFECVPRYCFEKNGRKLPFGCHGWNRYDRDFWERFLADV